MIRPSQAWRLIHINLVLLRHGLDEVILATHLFRPLRFLLYLSPWYWFRGELPRKNKERKKMTNSRKSEKLKKEKKDQKKNKNKLIKKKVKQQ